jgi:hypothetical protein
VTLTLCEPRPAGYTGRFTYNDPVIPFRIDTSSERWLPDVIVHADVTVLGREPRRCYRICAVGSRSAAGAYAGTAGLRGAMGVTRR